MGGRGSQDGVGVPDGLPRPTAPCLAMARTPWAMLGCAHSQFWDTASVP